jgi:hypothetical protein
MSRIVKVTRSGDRHADLHGRDFAESRKVVVPDGPIAELAAEALRAVAFQDGARFVILIEEPHLDDSAREGDR